MISERELKSAENAASRQVYVFAPFSFDVDNKTLWRDSEMVSLPPKTCELLAVLLENPGEILSKEELMNRVWKETYVEEANLSHHIAVLRKALGEDKKGRKFIQTVPRKGYRFVAPVSGVTNDALEISISERTTVEVLEEIEIETGNDSGQANEPKLISRNEISVSAGKFTKRAAIYLLLALIVVSGIAVFFWLKIFRAEDRQIANRQSNVASSLSFERITNSGKVGASNISPDGKFTSYLQNYWDGVGAVYVRQIDTNIERRLAVHERGEFGMTAFSPDGAYVFYVARDAAHPVFALYRVPVLGGSTVRVADKLERNHFILSPDGSEIATVRFDAETKSFSLFAVRLDGSGAERVLTTLPLQEMKLYPTGTWSPDGRTIVLAATLAGVTNNYSRAADSLLAFDTETGELRKFTEETWTEFGRMEWMPDASGVVVIGQKPRRRNQIYFVDAATGEASRITSDANGYGNYGLGITKDGKTLVADVWEFPGRVWTVDAASGDAETASQLPAGNTIGQYGLSVFPDGRIVFTSRAGTSIDLWTTKESDTEASPLMSDAFFDTHPAVAPDGSFIVFASDRVGEGTSRLFRMNADGSQIRQLTSGEGFETAPDISPDGNWVIYHSAAFDPVKSEWTDTIRKVPSAGGASVELFAGCVAPAFSPDGERFSCIAALGNARARLIVVGAEGGAPLKTFEVKCHFHYYLPARWTPDGAALVYRSHENQKSNLWKQNLSGGSPAPLTDFKSETIYNFVFTRDGKRLLISRGTTLVNVVMLKNFRQRNSQ